MTQRDTLFNVRSKIDAELHAAIVRYATPAERGAYRNCLSIIDKELDITPPLAYEPSPDMDSGGVG